MSTHCTVELLSTYVDAELPEAERLDVEAHVEQCDECRRKLSSLKGVVGQLHRLEQVETPPTLGWEVQRRVRLERGKVPLSQHLEVRFGRLLRQPLLAPLFAIIIAFGAILYLLSLGVAQQRASGTQVVIGSADSGAAIGGDDGREDAGREPRSPTGESLDGVIAGTAQTVTAPVETAPSGAAPDEVARENTLFLAGRKFSLVDGVWVERALGDVTPSEIIDLTAGDTVPAPLAELRGREGVYRLRYGERVLEVVVPQPSEER